MMNKNILTLLFVRIVANFSDSLYYIATIWFIKKSMGSNTWVGIASFVVMLPVTLQIFYGPFIDRYSKKKLLMISIGLQAAVFAILVVLYNFNQLHAPILLGFIFIATMAEHLSYPTESALVPLLVDKQQLVKVNSIFTFTYSSLDIICNAISGMVIAIIGIKMVYALNSLTYVILFFCICFLLKLPKISVNEELESSKVSYKKDFLQGLHFIWALGKLRIFILVFTGINMLICIPIGLIPVLANTEQEYGFWMTAISIGTLCGSLLSAKLIRYSLKHIFVVAAFISGSTWLISYYLLSISLTATLTLFSCSWFTIAIMGVQFQTLLQSKIESIYLGRALTAVYAIQGSMAPVGYLLGGVLSDYFQPSHLYLIGSVTLLLAGCYFMQCPFLYNAHKEKLTSK
ncbi:MFS transporter [Microbacteriaceae bacterium 4G12]